VAGSASRVRRSRRLRLPPLLRRGRLTGGPAALGPAPGALRLLFCGRRGRFLLPRPAGPAAVSPFGMVRLGAWNSRQSTPRAGGEALPPCPRSAHAPLLQPGQRCLLSPDRQAAGFKYPVALTAAPGGRCVAVPPGVVCQDEAGRLWVCALAAALRHRPRPGRRRVPFGRPRPQRQPGGTPRWSASRPCAAPAITASQSSTVMLPEEDLSHAAGRRAARCAPRRPAPAPIRQPVSLAPAPHFAATTSHSLIVLSWLPEGASCRPG